MYLTYRELYLHVAQAWLRMPGTRAKNQIEMGGDQWCQYMSEMRTKPRELVRLCRASLENKLCWSQRTEQQTVNNKTLGENTTETRIMTK